MPTTVSQNLIQIVYDFYIASGVPDGPVGGLSLFASNGTIEIIPDYVEPSMSITPTSIRLPNGAKYDPYGTYQAPQTPGTVSVNVVIKPQAGGVLNNTETEIMAAYAGWSTLIGQRGTLYGIFGYNSSDNNIATATARLIGMGTSWSMPKQIPASIGGTGKTRKGIETVKVRFDFDLLTNWTWTF